MNEVIIKATQRIDFLENRISELQQNMPENVSGHLRITRAGNTYRYYQLQHGEKNGIYLPVGERATIEALAQKGYNEKALAAAGNEAEYLKKFISGYPLKQFEAVYPSLSDQRQSLINPVWLTDEQFMQQWLSQPYKRLGFSENDTTQFYTDKGERVRSKSEIMIANSLDKAGIPYKIEVPYYLNGYGWVSPDFTILLIRQRILKIWEHHGMMDDCDYVNKNFLGKNNAYIANGYYPGINLIQTFETQQYPLSTKIINEIIKKYLLG